MPRFCDVALAVPLDMAFTYSISDRTTPVLGGRVLRSRRDVREHDPTPVALRARAEASGVARFVRITAVPTGIAGAV